MKTNFLKKNKIWQKYLPILFLFILTINLTSCYTDYGLTSADYDVVLTKWDKTTKFDTLKTFAVVDSVFHIVGDKDEPDSELLSRQNDDLIISTIRTNMRDLGYEEIDTSRISAGEIPSVVIVINALGTQVDQYYAGGYYPGWGYPGWGWGGYYPYYPGYIGKSTYYVGTLYIDYFDVAASEIDPNDNLVAPWYATINGLLNQGTTERRLTNSINQAFDQSPYLKIK